MKQERPPHDPERVEGHDDPIARVLKFAGSRPQPDPERKVEFKNALRAEWRRAIESAPHGSRPTSRTFGSAMPKKRIVAIAASITAVAAVLLVALLLPSRVTKPPVEAQVVGRIVRSEGVARNTAGEELRAGAIIDTGDTGRMALALGPDISLRIDVDSRIVMIGERVVRLERGAVYVDARSDNSGSVLVHTPHGDVRDIGTQFEVRARGSAFGVRVREGEILINRGGAEMTARAGEGLHLDPGGRYVRSTIPIFGPEWAWTTTIAPQFQLEGGTVRQFLDWVAREQGWRWRFADGDTARTAAGIVTHGSLEGYTPEEALAIVLPTCGLSFVQNGDEVVVSFAKE
jgi:ferric-dicitrate binding protein FerR (iron transport regulator)